MLQGALIAESIQPGTSLDDLRLIVRRITRHAPDGTTDTQPPVWTDICEVRGRSTVTTRYWPAW